MAHNIVYHECPCCGSKKIEKVFDAKDATVSLEIFEIWECQKCKLRFTQQAPDGASIGAYYRSEDYVSHSETRRGLVNKLYMMVRRRTLRRKANLVRHSSGLNLKSGQLLDVGSGTGAFASVMKQQGWTVTGLEPDVLARENAQRYHDMELRPIGDLYHLPSGSFDVITLWHVLEHVHDLHGYLNRFHTILKKDGKLILALPNYTSYDARAYGENWAAYDVPRHLYHFSPLSVSVLCKREHFKIEKTFPMWYDSFYISMLSEQNKNRGKNGYLSAIVNGFLSNLMALAEHDRCSSVIYVLSKE